MNKLQNIEKFNKKENRLTYKKLESQLDHLVKGQEIQVLGLNYKIIRSIMSIKNIFEDNRSQSIESLEFFFFLKEIYFSLLEKNDSKNNQIQEFIDIIGKNYYYQSYKIQDYITSLRDYVFWQSSEIYLENMKKFVSHECSASDFACTVYFLIRNDRKESECLIKDFEKQSTLELNPKIFQFSKTISDFELVLEGFIPEPTTNLTEDELRQIVNNVLPKVQKYFTDKI